MCAELHSLGFCPSVGITTGIAFCGVVGSRGTRREYTVLGDIVNLSARLMQYATVNGGGVVVDEATMVAARDRLFFERLEPITVKGKKNVCKIFQPYPNRCVTRNMRVGEYCCKLWAFGFYSGICFVILVLFALCPCMLLTTILYSSFLLSPPPPPPPQHGARLCPAQGYGGPAARRSRAL